MPTGRMKDTARARAAGDEIRSVIAGYHWFTDWGRDTMISLEGLTLDYRPSRRGGVHPSDLRPLHPRRLDPQSVSGRKDDGLYHTADATLWFFHAVDRYLEYTGDRSLLRRVLPKLMGIVELPFSRNAVRHPCRS